MAGPAGKTFRDKSEGLPYRALFSRLKMHHLRLLLAIERTGSLRGAAEQLAITQPAVSKSLGELEVLLDAPLFERHARGVKPTRFCRPVLRYADLVSVNLENMYDELGAIKTGKVGRVRVGTIMEPTLGLVTRALRQICDQTPGILISAIVETSDVLANMLLSDEIDVAVGRIPQDLDHATFRFQAVGNELLSIVVAPDHPLVGQAVQPADIAGYTWILQPRPSPMRYLIDRWFEKHHLTPPFCQVETAALLMTMALLPGTETIAVLPKSIAEHYALSRMVAMLPLDIIGDENAYGIITRRGHALSQPAEIFIETVLSMREAGSTAV